MLLITFETFIINFNFFLLFLTMLFYLLQSSSFLSEKWLFLPNWSLLISNLLQASFLCLRWFSSGHFPLSNLYESLLFLSWILTSFLLLFNSQVTNLIWTFSPSSSSFISKQEKKEEKLQIKQNTNSILNLVNSSLGAILTPFILFINTFANFSLPADLKLMTSLVPALKSNWLMMHVTLMMLSYGALLCGCLLAIAFLIVDFFSTSTINSLSEKIETQLNPQIDSELDSLSLDFESQTLTPNFQTSGFLNSNQKKAFDLNSLPQENLKSERYLQEQQIALDEQNLSKILDNLSYRVLGFGFPLLTIGILSGAIWANQTWGSYWSWDPKETWALITWLVFAIYLHTRISYGWNGQQSALIASLGFIVIWICYLGVNLLGKGLHSYGFFN